MDGLIRRAFLWLEHIFRKWTARRSGRIGLDGSDWSRLVNIRIRREALSTAPIFQDALDLGHTAEQSQRDRIASRAAMNYWFVCDRAFTHKNQPLIYDPFASVSAEATTDCDSAIAAAERAWAHQPMKTQGGRELNEFWRHFELAHKTGEFAKPKLADSPAPPWWSADATLHLDGTPILHSPVETLRVEDAHLILANDLDPASDVDVRIWDDMLVASEAEDDVFRLPDQMSDFSVEMLETFDTESSDDDDDFFAPPDKAPAVDATPPAGVPIGNAPVALRAS